MKFRAKLRAIAKRKMFSRSLRYSISSLNSLQLSARLSISSSDAISCDVCSESKTMFCVSKSGNESISNRVMKNFGAMFETKSEIKSWAALWS